MPVNKILKSHPFCLSHSDCLEILLQIISKAICSIYEHYLSYKTPTVLLRQTTTVQCLKEGNLD